MIARGELKNDADATGGARALIDVAAIVPFTLAAVLVLVLIVIWVIPTCKGERKSYEQRRSERMEKLEKAVKSEFFLDWAKKARKIHPEGQYDKALCVICLEQFEDASQIRGLKCNHVFHQCCLDDWFSRQNEYCPLCHRLIIPGTAIHTPQTRNNSVERPIFAFIV